MTGATTSQATGTRVAVTYFQIFAASASAPLRWRVLSGNNRELGRSFETFPDTEACRQAIGDLRLALDLLLPQVRREGRDRWLWELRRADGAVLVVAAHPFDRQVRCRKAVDQFLLDARLAPVAESVLVTAARRFRRRSVRPVVWRSTPLFVPRSAHGFEHDASSRSDVAERNEGEVIG
ncbi:MAG TPA: hypothetical protein VGJ59_10515 [Jatrophihabitantaceae bacterium]